MQPDQPKGESYTGSAVEMKSTLWLAVEDIQDSAPLTVTIEDVERYDKVVFDAGRVEANKYALAFKGASKRLVLNATNRKALQRAFGNKVANWRGQKVELHIEPLPRKFNKHTHGIRVKAHADN